MSYMWIRERREYIEQFSGKTEGEDILIFAWKRESIFNAYLDISNLSVKIMTVFENTQSDNGYQEKNVWR